MIGLFIYSIVIAQISPNLILISDSSDNTLKDFITSEYGTYMLLVYIWLSYLGETIETKTIPVKEFSFEKGRYMLLNWYILYIQEQQHRNYTSSEFSMPNYNIYFRDPEEGNKTHAYLQLEGLVQLDKSQHSVNLYIYTHVIIYLICL
jgi:DNA mismatch repair protein MSH5